MTDKFTIPHGTRRSGRKVCSMEGAYHQLKIKPGTVYVNGCLKGFDDYQRNATWPRPQSFPKSPDLLQFPSTTRTEASTPTSHQPGIKPWYSLSRLARWIFRR